MDKVYVSFFRFFVTSVSACLFKTAATYDVEYLFVYMSQQRGVKLKRVQENPVGAVQNVSQAPVSFHKVFVPRGLVSVARRNLALDCLDFVQDLGYLGFDISNAYGTSALDALMRCWCGLYFVG